jgi:hypothetical protein
MSSEDCCVDDLKKMNRLVRILRNGMWNKDKKAMEKPFVWLPRLDHDKGVKVVIIVDAAEQKGERGYDARWMGGITVGLMEDDWHTSDKFAPVYFRAGKCKRVAHSSFDGETLAGIEGLDVGLSIAILVEEFISGVRPGFFDRKLAALDGIDLEPELTIPVEEHTDSQDLVDRVRKITFDTKITKRRKGDIADYQELIDLGVLKPLVKIAGSGNPVDPMTKYFNYDSWAHERLADIMRRGKYVMWHGAPPGP